MTYMQGGYFFTDPTGKNSSRKVNLEGIMQMSGTAVTGGFANYMVEFALLLRYEVVYPG